MNPKQMVCRVFEKQKGPQHHKSFSLHKSWHMVHLLLCNLCFTPDPPGVCAAEKNVVQMLYESTNANPDQNAPSIG